MKKVFLILFCFTLFNCTTNDSIDEIAEATLVGRWNLDGFQGNVLYEFTENKRFTLYSSDGEFGTIQELIDLGHSGNDWWYDEDKVTVDLNFGNLSTLTPFFKCNNNVIEWLNEADEVVSKYYREEYDLVDCNE